jgi:hypothetical protein
MWAIMLRNSTHSALGLTGISEGWWQEHPAICEQFKLHTHGSSTVLIICSHEDRKKKNLPLSGEKHGKVKSMIQTFKFAFLNTNGKIKSVLIFLSGQTFPS